MAETTIGWTAIRLPNGEMMRGYTFNPWIGCQCVSEGCINCYAIDWSKWTGLVEWGPGQPRKRTVNWSEPIKINRMARKLGVRVKVFTASLGDVFDNAVPEQWRADLWELIAKTPYLDWLLLTKRPQNIRKMLPDNWGTGWPHVWLGVSVENMEWARRRIPILLSIPAVRRYLSCEPMLEPLDLREWLGEGMIDWVICGGESGGKERRRDMDPAWARDLRDQSIERGVAFFMKQMSAGSSHEGESLIPPDLLIQQWPTTPRMAFIVAATLQPNRRGEPDVGRKSRKATRAPADAGLRPE